MVYTYFKKYSLSMLVSTILVTSLLGEAANLVDTFTQTSQESARRKQFILQQLKGFAHFERKQQDDLELIIKLLIGKCDMLAQVDVDEEITPQLVAIHDQLVEVGKLIKTINTKPVAALVERLNGLVEADKELDAAERKALVDQALIQTSSLAEELNEIAKRLEKPEDPHALYKMLGSTALALVGGYALANVYLKYYRKADSMNTCLFAIAYAAMLYHGCKFAKVAYDHFTEEEK